MRTPSPPAEAALSVKPADILRKAKELIEAKGWTQETFARDISGQPLILEDISRAVCFCGYGAVAFAAGLERFFHVYQIEAVSYLDEAVKAPPREFPLWQDSPNRTREDVILAFDRAIALAESA